MHWSLCFQKACSDVTISDDKNRYDSLDEMKRYVGSRVKDFNIRGDNPKVHFLLNKAENVPSSLWCKSGFRNGKDCVIHRDDS